MAQSEVVQKDSVPPGAGTDKGIDVREASIPRPETYNEEYKIFNDSVHGHIKMHPLLVKIIDTPAFQRLRNIKQLGGGYFVFPGASHNRFEHSIGVAHLAGELVRSLRDKENPADEDESKITVKDELCVQIAGLCHDLGHGPFSHVFEEFMKATQENWKHEAVSVKMFEYLINKEPKEPRSQTIKQIMVDEYEFEDSDFEFIKELIHDSYTSTEGEWPYKGRTEDKSYLYEIVANKVTGIDVDKMDYFIRDCLHLGMKSNFSHERYVMFARVCTNEKNKKQICTRDKEALNMCELFYIRYQLHHNAYQHRVKTAVEMMIVEALSAADDFRGDIKISEISNNLEQYVELTDDILEKIKTKQPQSEASALIERIVRRDLYICVGTKLFKPERLAELKTVAEKQKIVELWLRGIKKQNLNAADFRVKCVKIDYGMKKQNPIDSLRFYKKQDEQTGIPLPANEISYIRPEIFYEVKVMLFYTQKIEPPLISEDVDIFWDLIQK